MGRTGGQMVGRWWGDLDRKLRYQQAGAGECVTIDDDGSQLIWCKETNLLYSKMEEDETPPKNSHTGEVSEMYSEKLHSMCVGKMVQDGINGSQKIRQVGCSVVSTKKATVNNFFMNFR